MRGWLGLAAWWRGIREHATHRTRVGERALALVEAHLMREVIRGHQRSSEVIRGQSPSLKRTPKTIGHSRPLAP